MYVNISQSIKIFLISLYAQHLKVEEEEQEEKLFVDM
jgi:hypothetical protein